MVYLIGLSEFRSNFAFRNLLGRHCRRRGRGSYQLLCGGPFMPIQIAVLCRLAMRSMIVSFAMACLLTPALAQQEGLYTIAHFEFEGGGSLDAMKVSYVTYGKRDTRDDNVIVLVPPTSGFKGWAAAHIGAGKTFDPEKHFIVSIDAIGGGGSSQPRDGLGTRFPQYNIRDMVRAQHALLTEGLGIQRALAIGGASSGAFQALEWGFSTLASRVGSCLRRRCPGEPAGQADYRSRSSPL